MKRNVMLAVGLFVMLILAYSSFQRILTFKGTATIVEMEEKKLEELKVENERLKNELAYKQGERFVEGEIRDKLGLAKEGEEVVVVPNDNNEGTVGEVIKRKTLPNWKKWRNLLLGKS